MNCKKKTPKGEIIALTNHEKPPELILNKLKEFSVTSFRKLSSSYKYCLVATGEYDLYLDKEIILMLPSNNLSDAIKIFKKYNLNNEIKIKTTIDLRIPNRIIIRNG